MAPHLGVSYVVVDTINSTCDCVRGTGVCMCGPGGIGGYMRSGVCICVQIKWECHVVWV